MCLTFFPKKSKPKPTSTYNSHDNEVYEGCRMTVLIQNRNSVHFIPRQCGAKIYENGFCKIHNEAFNCINKNF